MSPDSHLDSLPILFAMPPKEDVAAMLRADLADARREWLKAGGTPAERLQREQSDFLTADNHEGETLDFHALRHSCGAWLAQSGAHAKAVQAVMHHSTITLTMATYGHLFPGQEAATVAGLPDMLGFLPQVLRATGTADQSPQEDGGSGQHLGQQLDGEIRRVTAKINEKVANLRRMVEDRATGPQVVTVARNSKGRRATATPGPKAEGRGLEPPTGYPAPDFESGC